MLSTPHLLVGATVGSFTRNPLAAFAAGFVSHFIMDRVPHWDWKPTGWKMIALTFAEFFFGAGLLFFLTKNSSNPFLIWAGAVGGVCPDALAAPYYLLHQEIKVLEPLRRFHNLTQTGNNKFPKIAGILTQILVLIITTLFLSR